MAIFRRSYRDRGEFHESIGAAPAVGRPILERDVVAGDAVGSRDYVSPIISFVVGVIEVLLGLRLLLRLFGASTISTFVQAVYSLSYPLIAPFTGIFPNVNADVAAIEVATLVAMAVYGVVGYLLIRLARGLLDRDLY